MLRLFLAVFLISVYLIGCDFEQPATNDVVVSKIRTGLKSQPIKYTEIKNTAKNKRNIISPSDYKIPLHRSGLGTDTVYPKVIGRAALESGTIFFVPGRIIQ